MTKNDLTSKQIDYLKDLLVERIVDNKSTEDLVAYVTDDLTKYFKDLSDKEVLRQAEDYWDDHFPDIIKEIKEDCND
tara:strand:- start:1302 stop:1532 length:231 start_codon:yes stop_codon:yes gene_type:complete